MGGANPIFNREFTALGRSWKTRAVIAGYIGALTALLFLLWPSGGVQSVVTGGARQIFSMFFSVNLALLLLLVPAFAAGAITVERERGTYPALFTTPLRPFDIMAGKLAAAILFILIMTVLSLPIAAVCALAGGVDSIFMGRVILLLFATAVSYGLIGLACSSLCARTTGAVLLNYVLVLVLAGATWLPSALLSNLLPEMNGFFQALRSLSPFDALWYVLFPDQYKLTTTVAADAAWLNPFQIYLTASAVLSVLAFLIFRRNVLRPEIRSRRTKGQIYTGGRKALKRKLTFPFYLLDPLKRKKPIGRLSNPVFVAEMRSKLFSNPNFVIRTVCVIFMLSLGLLTLLAFQLGGEIEGETVKTVAIVFQIGVVAILAPGVAAGLITDEITGGTFMALRMTPLSPLTVILGKLKATFFYALIFIVSSVFVLLAMAYLEQCNLYPDLSALDPEFYPALWQKMRTEPDWWSNFFHTYRGILWWCVLLLISAMTFLSAGLFASAFARDTPSATAGAYGITAAICIVTLLPIPLAGKLAPGVAELILSFNPVVAALQVTAGAFPQYPGLWLHNLWALLGLDALFLGAAVGRVCYLFRKQH